MVARSCRCKVQRFWSSSGLVCMCLCWDDLSWVKSPLSVDKGQGRPIRLCHCCWPAMSHLSGAMVLHKNNERCLLLAGCAKHKNSSQPKHDKHLVTDLPQNNNDNEELDVAIRPSANVGFCATVTVQSVLWCGAAFSCSGPTECWYPLPRQSGMNCYSKGLC